MVARRVEERHPQRLGETRELFPLLFQRRAILRVALDKIANADHEFRPEQVQFRDSKGEHAGTSAACTVGEDRELEFLGPVLEPQMGPRLRLGLDAVFEDGVIGQQAWPDRKCDDKQEACTR